MGEMRLKELVEWISKLSPFMIVCVIGYLGYKRVWVWGYQLDECKQERDGWKQAAMRVSAAADKSTDIAQTLVSERRG